MRIFSGSCDLCSNRERVFHDGRITKPIKMTFLTPKRLLPDPDSTKQIFDKAEWLHTCPTCAHKVQVSYRMKLNYTMVRRKKMHHMNCMLCGIQDAVMLYPHENPKIQSDIKKYLEWWNGPKHYTMNERSVVCLECLFALKIWDETNTLVFNALGLSHPSSSEKDTAISSRDKTVIVSPPRPKSVTPKKLESTKGKSLNSSGSDVEFVSDVPSRRSRRLLTSSSSPEHAKKRQHSDPAHSENKDSSASGTDKKIIESPSQDKNVSSLKLRLRARKLSSGSSSGVEFISETPSRRSTRLFSSFRNLRERTKKSLSIIKSPKRKNNGKVSTKWSLYLKKRFEKMRLVRDFKKINFKASIKNDNKMYRSIPYVKVQVMEAPVIHTEVISSDEEEKSSPSKLPHIISSPNDYDINRYLCHVCDKSFILKCNYLTHCLKHEKMEELVVNVKRLPVDKNGKLKRARKEPYLLPKEKVDHLLIKYLGTSVIMEDEEEDNNKSDLEESRLSTNDRKETEIPSKRKKTPFTFKINLNNNKLKKPTSQLFHKRGKNQNIDDEDAEMEDMEIDITEKREETEDENINPNDEENKMDVGNEHEEENDVITDNKNKRKKSTESLTPEVSPLQVSESSEAEEDENVVEKVSKHVEQPSKDVEEPSKNAEVSESSEVEEDENGEVVSDVKQPSKDGEEPSKNVEEPSKNVEEPSKNVEEPSKNVEEPSKNVEEPIEISSSHTFRQKENEESTNKPPKTSEIPDKDVECPVEQEKNEDLPDLDHHDSDNDSEATIDLHHNTKSKEVTNKPKEVNIEDSTVNKEIQNDEEVTQNDETVVESLRVEVESPPPEIISQELTESSNSQESPPQPSTLKAVSSQESDSEQNENREKTILEITENNDHLESTEEKNTKEDLDKNNSKESKNIENQAESDGDITVISSSSISFSELAKSPVLTTHTNRRMTMITEVTEDGEGDTQTDQIEKESISVETISLVETDKVALADVVEDESARCNEEDTVKETSSSTIKEKENLTPQTYHDEDINSNKSYDSTILEDAVIKQVEMLGENVVCVSDSEISETGLDSPLLLDEDFAVEDEPISTQINSPPVMTNEELLNCLERGYDDEEETDDNKRKRKDSESSERDVKRCKTD